MISLNGFLRGLSYPCEVPDEVSFHGVFPKTVAKKGKHSTSYLNSSSKANMFAGNYLFCRYDWHFPDPEELHD